jgi:hypothetical protein
MTVSQSTIAYDGINYNSSSLSSITGSWNFLQAVEDGYVFNVGKTLTLSFVASGSGTIQPITWIGTVAQQNFGSSFALTSTPTRYEITHTITGSGSGDDLYIGFSGSGGSFNVSLVQLEVGDTATPFEHRSYSDEIQRCQRYFVRLGGVGRDYFVGGSNATTGYFSTDLPVQMRAAPSLSNSGGFTVNNFSSAGTPSDINVELSSKNRFGFTTVGGVTYTLGNAVVLYETSTNSGNLKLDAEL